MLQVAEQLFSKHVYQGVSVEMLAREAGMSKVTVYAYFHDKSDVFRQVAECVCDRIRVAVVEAAAANANPKEKIIAVLQAKDELIYNIVRSSPHANELLAARDLLVKEYFEQFNSDNEKTISRLIKQLDEKNIIATPMRMARLLLQTSRGLTQGASDRKQLRRDIALVIGKLID